MTRYFGLKLCKHAKNDCQNYNIQKRIFIWLHLLKKGKGDKKIVRVTKNDCYFNRYGCSLRNKARLSVLQIFVTVTKSFFACMMKLIKFLLWNKLPMRSQNLYMSGTIFIFLNNYILQNNALFSVSIF